ncbi:hypothetical protein D3C87_1875960 [compost metagenome]
MDGALAVFCVYHVAAEPVILCAGKASAQLGFSADASCNPYVCFIPRCKNRRSDFHGGNLFDWKRGVLDWLLVVGHPRFW